MKWNMDRFAEVHRILILYEANGTNISDISLSDLPYLDEPVIWKKLDTEGYIKFFAYLFIIIVGFLGNIGVILTVISAKSLWKTINFCMVNLAFTDAMICVFCMVPSVIDTMTVHVFVLGSFMCKFTPFTQMACLICSVLTLSTMSCNRFMTIMYPMQARARKLRISVLITFIWAVSLVLSLPFLLLKEIIVLEWKDFNETKCVEAWSGDYAHLRRAYYITISIALFFIPTAIMIISNSLVLFKLWTSRIPGEPNPNNEIIRSRTKRKWTKMVLIMLIVFIICWTPIIGTFLYGFSTPKGQSMPLWYAEVRWFAFYMAYANSFMNPIIYGGFNEAFRRQFYSLLRCKSQRQRFAGSFRSRVTYTTSLISSVSRRLSRTISQASNKSCKIEATNTEMYGNMPNICICRTKESSISSNRRRVQSI